MLLGQKLAQTAELNIQLHARCSALACRCKTCCSTRQTSAKVVSVHDKQEGGPGPQGRGGANVSSWCPLLEALCQYAYLALDKAQPDTSAL